MKPVATYRLQLNKDFTFDDSKAISAYLKELGISHLYLSPILESSLGSNHGYDATDFAHISEERGGSLSFKLLVEAANKEQLRVILDIVPNHMAANLENKYWKDILRNGPKSVFFPLFDIKTAIGEKLRLPILGQDLEEEIKKGKISLSDKEGETGFAYGDQLFPMNEESHATYQRGDLTSVKELLEMQHYELVFWADKEKPLNYRRFFDITGLAGVRVEHNEVFDLTHKFIFELIQNNPAIDGVRIDHIDGLADPEKYLNDLEKEIPDIWIEKILAPEEHIPAEWKTLGTTGYEFIEYMNQLMLNKAGFSKIEEFWRKNSEIQWENFEACVTDGKFEIINNSLKPELDRLVSLTIIEEDERQEAEIFWLWLTIAMPVYRIYTDNFSLDDPFLNKALIKARTLGGQNFIESEKKYLPLFLNPETENHKKALLEWKQLSGPAMAKGLEDTAHYRYTPLLALNEVGCEARIDKPHKNSFFEWINARSQTHPYSLNATSTHDTKRSEDARHRLYALADRPDEWINFCNKFIPSKPPIPFSSCYMIIQTIISIWPLNGQIDEDFIARIKTYAQKAFREQKIYTRWTSPSDEFEKEISDFIETMLHEKEFINHASDMAGRISMNGALNSLSVLTLKILNSGIPDFYQGTEKWEFNLVDPDNRRPIDYASRKENLQDIGDMTDLLRNWKDGRIKLWMTQKLLDIRRSLIPDLTQLEIEVLETVGSIADHLIAYALRNKNKESGLIIACPRYPGKLKFTEDFKVDWMDTALILPKEFSNYTLTDMLQGNNIEMDNFKAAEIFKSLPISVIGFGNKIA